MVGKKAKDYLKKVTAKLTLDGRWEMKFFTSDGSFWSPMDINRLVRMLKLELRREQREAAMRIASESANSESANGERTVDRDA